MVVRESKCGWKPSVNAKDAEKAKEFTAHLEEVTEQREKELQETWDRQHIEGKKSHMHITCPWNNDSEGDESHKFEFFENNITEFKAVSC